MAEAVYWKVSFPKRPGPHRLNLNLMLRKSRDTSILFSTIIPGDERQRFAGSDGPRPLGKRTDVALATDRLYVATGDSAVVRVFDFSGKELQPIKLDYRPMRVERQDIDSYVDYLIAESAPKVAAQFRSIYSQLEYPKEFPRTGQILVDHFDRLWVEEYRPPFEDISNWTIIDRSGAALGKISLPRNFRLAEIGSDYLLGSWRDDNDIERIRAYHYTTSSRGGLKR